MMKPKTVLDGFRVYEARLLEMGKPAEVKNMQTVLLRSTVPGWGGPTPKNSKRSTRQDIEAGLNFLGLLSIEKLREGIAAQERFFNQTSVAAKHRSNAKYYLNKLITLAESEGWLRGKKTAETPKPTQLNLVGGKKVLPRPNLTNRRPKLNYRLGSQTEDFISSRLQNQIDDFRQWYISRKLAEKTFNNHLITLKQFFGWLIRYELASQWQPLQGDEKVARFKAILDSFCFESMIPFFPLPKRSRFTTRSEYIEAKEDAKDIRTEEAEETLKLFERFLDFYSATHSTRGNLIGMSVNVTKYLYKNQIDESNIETIPPILLKLKALRRVEEKGARNSPRAVPIEKKFIEYEEVLRVVVELKKLADQKKRTDNGPRVPSAIASAYSRFLMISFLSLLPPDRQQFIRELEI